jgi:hypothetical protein
MPPKRESLESVKKRLTREKKSRTDRRVRELLQARQRLQETEVSDDSEEENRLSLLVRRARGNRDQATQTDSLSLSFGRGVLVGVFGVLCLLFCLIAVSDNDRQGWRGKGEKVLRRSPKKRGKKCGRPFTAPKRPVAKDTEDSDV